MSNSPGTVCLIHFLHAKVLLYLFLVQYTPLVEVNQKMFAWSFRQFGILTHTQNCLDMFEVREWPTRVFQYWLYIIFGAAVQTD